ncbi:type II secretion system protein [Azotobacter chroococcum]|nr:type II secretion system protein [Azotobacter chroococcum]
MRRQAGFTLIELLVVMAIIASLLTIAVPRYFSSLEYSRETTLKQSLAVMRDALDQYYGDTGSYPESLETLVEQRYLRNLPVDPISERNDQWLVLPPPEGVPGSVADVRSGADGRAKDGSLYAEW